MFKQGAGLAVTLAVAFAAMRFSSPGIPPGAMQAPPPPPKRAIPNSQAPSPHAQDADFKGECTAYLPEKKNAPYPYDENQGVAKKVLDRFFGSDTPDVPSNELPSDVRFAIALSPDPRHTNLGLMFDREIEAINQAAQDGGYVYNSSWLPWAREATPETPYLADRQHLADLIEAREACPGILLFRKKTDPEKAGLPEDPSYSTGLVVFVVGEQPTGGINELQWKNAIIWLGKFAKRRKNNSPPDDGVLRVLGPTFTGSVVSLARDVELAPAVLNAEDEEATVKVKGEKFNELRVFSGSVTGCSAVQWFAGRLKHSSAWNHAEGDENANFGTFQENDEVQIARFLQYLTDQVADPKDTAILRDTAILSEDETAYSDFEGSKNRLCKTTYDKDNDPVHLVYPRDISAVRDAYQKQSIFGGAGESKPGVSHPILRDEAEDKADGREITDTVPAYGGRSAAIAQEAYLFGTVSFLRTHHIRYLVLRCTNPLDFLFLTRFFHRAYPEARIVTVGSDLLVRREIDTTEFRGVLSLSSYPLLPRDQHWAKITETDWDLKPHNHRVFEGHVMEGTYIAASYLLQDSDPLTLVPRAGKDGCIPPIQLSRVISTPDYAPPSWLNESDSGFTSHPPTWVAAVGRDGYWPIAVLGQQRSEADCIDIKSNPKSSQPGSTMVELMEDSRALTLGRQYYESSKLSLPLPWIVVALLSLALVCYQILGVTKGWQHPKGLFVVFQKSQIPSQAALLGLSCALALLPLIEVCSVAMLSELSRLTTRASCYLVIAGLLAWIAAASIAVILQENYRNGTVWFFLGSLTILLVILLLAFSKDINNSTVRIPLFYRMVHMSDGASPLVPVLLLTLGFYLWNWHAMSGNLLLDEGRPELPECDPAFSQIRHCLLCDSESRISRKVSNRISQIANPVFAGLRVSGAPLFLFGGALVCFIPGNLPLLSLECGAFNYIIDGFLTLAFLLTSAEALRLYFTWIELRRLLHALGRLRLRRTMARLRPIDAKSIWSVSGNAHRIQYRLFVQQLDAARRTARLSSKRLLYLNRVTTYGEEYVARSESSVAVFTAWEEPIRPRPVTFLDPLLSIRDVLCNGVADVINEVLLPEWQSELNSLNLEVGLSVGEDDAEDASQMPLSKKELIRAAEEFVSYHYIAFIQNIMARMRTMTLSMIFLFVSVCFAISFYPFVPRTEVSVWMILNLALITFTVAYVYAGMDRDEIMSYVANSKPGKLGGEFWVKMAGFLAAPVIGILTTQFPAITDSVLGWLQPGLDAISK